MHQRQLAQYQATPAQYFMAEQTWLESGWQAMPSVRRDLRGYNDFAFNLQWKGSADDITTALGTTTWQPASTNLQHYFNWFNPSATIDELPLLPHVHDGQYEELRFSTVIPPDKLLVIRLWPSQIEIQTSQGKTPMWFGYISQMKKINKFGFHYLVTAPDLSSPLHWFQSQPPGDSAMPRHREHGLAQGKTMEQQVLLLKTN